MDINVAKFRQNYRNQLKLVLEGYKRKISDANELWWVVNVRMPKHPRKSYYYHLNLSMAQERLEELR